MIRFSPGFCLPLISFASALWLSCFNFADFVALGSLIKECFQLSNFPIVDHVEAHDFTERLNIGNALPMHAVSLWTHYEQNPSHLLRHPLFWSGAMCLEFVKRLGGLLMSIAGRTKAATFRNTFRTAMDIPINNWQASVDSNTQTHIGKKTYGTFDCLSSTDLLKMMRHKRIHFLELQTVDQSFYGMLPEAFYEHFRSDYPDLLMRAYNALEQYIALLPDLPNGYFDDLLLR